MRRFILTALLLASAAIAQKPFIEKEDIFPLDAKHNHASSILLLPGGNLLVCWYRGSGERTADDVQIMGARRRKGAKSWSAPFVLADQPGFPDTNPTLFLDRDKRVWLIWQTIVANRWETAISPYRISSNYARDGVPAWERSDVLLLKPADIEKLVEAAAAKYKDGPFAEYWKRQVEKAKDKYFARMGWMTRAHPLQLASGRILMPLYSDGFSFSLVGISDDKGLTWHASQPIIGGGNIQPTFAVRKDGAIVAYMRDNGPPPKRVHVSRSTDNGETWSPAEDTDIPNSGTGLEVINLRDGRWLMINNDTERDRYSLALTISGDEGKTWKWKRHIELDTRADRRGSFHYPSIVQAPDGTIHASYSVFHNEIPEGQPKKTIRHAHFNLAWVEEGDR
ncbi:MAG: exo-alpha-sialidase [Candidatus Solibacter usitatus]|nr:exo-alpha-sialidase [Candidatus Solibacter usitatus]